MTKHAQKQGEQLNLQFNREKIYMDMSECIVWIQQSKLQFNRNGKDLCIRSVKMDTYS